MKPIETVYKSYRFRSRLEARWSLSIEAASQTLQSNLSGFLLCRPRITFSIFPISSIFGSAYYWIIEAPALIFPMTSQATPRTIRFNRCIFGRVFMSFSTMRSKLNKIMLPMTEKAQRKIRINACAVKAPDLRVKYQKISWSIRSKCRLEFFRTPTSFATIFERRARGIMNSSVSGCHSALRFGRHTNDCTILPQQLPIALHPARFEHGETPKRGRFDFGKL